MARLGDHVEEQRLTLGSEGADGRQLIGVSNDAGLHASTRQPSADLSRYQRVEQDWFAYNPMRADVGSIGLADDDGKVGFTSPDYVVFSCRESLDPRYLLAYLKSDYGLEAIVRSSSGAVRKRLYFTGLAEIDLPIPSLAEQRALIDRLADTGEKLAAVGAANPSADELARLRQSILDEAIRGRLTASWRAGHPVGEPAPALLARIATERARLVKEKKLRKTKPLPPLTPDEQPFDLPNGWAWCRAGDIASFLNGYAFKSSNFKKTGMRLVRNANVSHGRLDWTDAACISSESAADYERFSMKPGDIVLSLDRPLISTGLKAAVVREEDVPSLLLQRVVKIDPFEVERPYLFRWLFSNLFLSTIDPGRSIGVPHISHKSVMAAPFPLPPLAEQSAIATRVAALLSTCDTLDREITRAAAHAAALLRAVLREAFQPPAF